MSGKEFCHVGACDNQDFSALLFNGQQFCKDHYAKIFFEQLSTLFQEWDGVCDPPDRLKYLVGRYYAEHEIALINKPSLTKAIVHERSFGWKRTGDGAVFTVIRYPVNRRMGYPYCDELHQTWVFNVKELTFTFLSEKKMK